MKNNIDKIWDKHPVFNYTCTACSRAFQNIPAIATWVTASTCMHEAASFFLLMAYLARESRFASKQSIIDKEGCTAWINTSISY